MKKLSNNEKLLVILLSIFIVGFIYQRYILSPILSEVQSVNKEITINQNKVIDIKNAEIKNKNQATQLKDIKLKFENTIKALPQSSRNPEISLNLKKFSDNSKVIITSMVLAVGVENTDGKDATKTNATQTNEVKVMLSPAIIEVTGDYLSIMNYITSIEKDHRIAEVNDVNISNESGVIKGVINVKYYYVDGMNANTTSYDFNKGAYGKGNLFK